jgi:hypothetical protein
METFGRERRHRYYTVASYRRLVAQENLDQTTAGYENVDLSCIGEFAPIDFRSFYKDKETLFNYQDGYRANEIAQGAAKLKNTHKNPILADGSIKQGRPRKPKKDAVKKPKQTKPKVHVDVQKDAIDVGSRAKRKRMEDDDTVNQNHLASDAHTNLSSLKRRRVGHNWEDPKESLPDDRLTFGDRQFGNVHNHTNGNFDGTSSAKRGRPDGFGSDGEPDFQPRTAQQEGRLVATGREVSVSTETRARKRVRLGEPALEVPIPSVIRRVTSNLSEDDLNSRFSSPLSDVPESPQLEDLSVSVDRSPGSNELLPTPPSSSIPIDPVLVEESHHQRFPSGECSNSDNITQTAKRMSNQPSTSQRAKLNVSSLRRENELYRVVESFGGIVNIYAKEFYDAHSALIEAMIEAGESTSTPIGTRLDKRTACMAFDNMECRGRIKILKTSTTTPTGVSRPACVVYLPDLEEERLGSFLANLPHHRPLAQPAIIKKIDQRMDYGASTRVQRNAIPFQLLQPEQPGEENQEGLNKNAARANQLFSYDDATIRDVLRTERTTMAQSYGFIVGKAARVKHFHTSMLHLFQNADTSPHIVSCEQRIIHTSYFLYDLPLSIYCALIPPSEHDDRLTSLLETNEGRQAPVHAIPSSLHLLLQIGRARARAGFLQLLVFLQSLDLVKPLQVSNSDAPQIICLPGGQHPAAFDVGSMEGWSANAPMTAPVYWCFSSVVPLYLWVLSETCPPFWRNVSVISHDDAEAYWKDLHLACTDRTMAEATPHDDIYLSTNLNVARSLRRSASWKSDYFLTWHQSQYLRRFVEFSTGNTPLQTNGGGGTLEKISWVVCAPLSAVHQFFAHARSKTIFTLERTRRKTSRISAEDKAKLAVEARGLLAKKAAEAKAQREQAWEDLVHRLHPEPLKGSTSVRLRRVRTRFLQSGSGKDVRKWEDEVTQAIREVSIAAAKILKPTKQPTIIPRAPPPIVPNLLEKSVEDLIVQQGPPLTPKPVVKKHKGKGKDTMAGSSLSPRLFHYMF